MNFGPIDLVDILPVALVALFVYNSKWIPRAEGLNSGYLSVSTSKSLRGVMAIIVLFHHLAQNFAAGFLFHPFTRLGFLPVSVFFFLSGYGLQKSHMRSENYRKRFLLKRIPQVLFPYIIVIVLFWAAYAVNGKMYSFKEIILSFVKGDPFVPFSWYIINILIFYIVFWLLMLLFRKRYLLMIVGAVLWYGAYAFFCYKMGYTSYWYSSSHLLIIGMIWAVYEDKILAFIKKRYFLLSIFSLISFLILYILYARFYTKATTIKTVFLLLTMAVSVLFALCVNLYLLRFRFGNRILEFLGGCSLEIYLIQGLFILGFRSSKVNIENDFLWALAVIAGSILLGYLLHFVFTRILRGYRKLLRLDQ